MSKQNACIPGAPGHVPQLSADEVQLLLRTEEKPFLLDVREPAELRDGFVKGSENIPLSDVLSGARDNDLPKGKLIVIVCRSGARANVAASALSAKGFQCAVLAGGMIAWKAKRQ